MSEDKKSLINLVPDSVDNAVKNITDKPTQNIGTTLADIWYLVFGGISEAAEKRKLKYSYALQEFEKELKEKINKIPENKLVEPDIQLIAKTLESAKYCVEKEDLREMFSNLISKSLSSDTNQYVHPIYINIISQLSSSDAKIIKTIYGMGQKVYRNISASETEDDVYQLLLSISVLEYSGLIESDIHKKIVTFPWIKNQIIHIHNPSDKEYNGWSDVEEHNRIRIKLTELGRLFCATCIDN